VQGSNDVIVPTVNSYILQQNLPNAQLILYPDSNHGSFYQYLELFVSQADEFLTSGVQGDDADPAAIPRHCLRRQRLAGTGAKAAPRSELHLLLLLEGMLSLSDLIEPSESTRLCHDGIESRNT
jgi:hypothetical protein